MPMVFKPAVGDLVSWRSLVGMIVHDGAYTPTDRFGFVTIHEDGKTHMLENYRMQELDTFDRAVAFTGTITPAMQIAIDAIREVNRCKPKGKKK